jgi:AraC family transcriptional regulator
MDGSREHDMNRIMGSSCLLSSYGAQWRGINLAVYSSQPFETPECVTAQHVITFPSQQFFQVEETAEGQRQTATFHPGDISFAPSGMPRQYYWRRPIETAHLVLDPTYIHHTVRDAVDPDRVELISHFFSSDPLIYQLGQTLIQELRTNPSHSALFAESVATLLGMHLLRHYTSHHTSLPSHHDGLAQTKLQVAIDYIAEHLAEDISLEAIATQLGISRYYFCRLFKQSMGVSPYQYIIQQRIERAKHLLGNSPMSISEVALACGFAHQSHLNYHFKKVVGMTPRRFIKSL